MLCGPCVAEVRPVGVCRWGSGMPRIVATGTTCSRRGNFSACWCRKVGIEGGSYHGWVSRNVGNAHIAFRLTHDSAFPPFVPEVVRALGANPVRPRRPRAARRGNCTVRASTCRQHADTQDPLSRGSGSVGVPTTPGRDTAKGARRGKAAGQQVSLRRLGEVCERRGECVLKDPSCIGNNRYLMIDSGVERLLFGLSHPKVSNV